MLVCIFFWLIALPLVVLTWRSSRSKELIWEERLIGSILLFLPIIGLLVWLTFFNVPPSHKPDDLTGPYHRGLGGSGYMHDSINLRLKGPVQHLHISDATKKQWRFIRWPIFASLIALVAWFNWILW